MSNDDVPEIWREMFLATRAIPGVGVCGVQRFMLTCGLLVRLEFDGMFYDYSARYCYPLQRDALRDLEAWDGAGDPPGEWIKEKVSERTRVSDG